MGWRFRKRIKLAPGIHINVSKSGLSTSIGTNGLTVNVGKNGVTETASIPGTGLSYQHRHPAAPAKRDVPATDSGGASSTFWPVISIALLALIFWLLLFR